MNGLRRRLCFSRSSRTGNLLLGMDSWRLELVHTMGLLWRVPRLDTFDGTGRRHSAADLLSYANPSNIKVAIYATVERILVTSSLAFPAPKHSAIGVVFRDQVGQFHHAMLREKGIRATSSLETIAGGLVKQIERAFPACLRPYKAFFNRQTRGSLIGLRDRDRGMPDSLESIQVLKE